MAKSTLNLFFNNMNHKTFNLFRRAYWNKKLWLQGDMPSENPLSILLDEDIALPSKEFQENGSNYDEYPFYAYQTIQYSDNDLLEKALETVSSRLRVTQIHTAGFYNVKSHILINELPLVQENEISYYGVRGIAQELNEEIQNNHQAAKFEVLNQELFLGKHAVLKEENRHVAADVIFKDIYINNQADKNRGQAVENIVTAFKSTVEIPESTGKNGYVLGEKDNVSGESTTFSKFSEIDINNAGSHEKIEHPQTIVDVREEGVGLVEKANTSVNHVVSEVSDIHNATDNKSEIAKHVNKLDKNNDISQNEDSVASSHNDVSIIENPVIAENIAEHAAQAGRAGHHGNYRIHYSSKYGNYINVTDFGADPSGKKDSLAAIQSALAIAHKEKAMVFMEGKFYISNQIVLNESNAGVRGIFGSGMGKTVISFDKEQAGVFNSNSNHDDIRAYAGILIDGQNNKTIAELSVKYTNSNDYYRKGESYFGKVSGILVNDADNTLISKVEASGANRAGVLFTSTAALTKAIGTNSTYKALVQKGELDDSSANLPLGENNRILDSNLHHNRVAGAMVAYQKGFVAEDNYLSWNGHKADGGTGYGITAMAGSYNYGITFRHNTTDHNYRKGLDVHDGTGIVIESNTSIGDRLYGIAVYNRQFSMDNVKITGNKITQDDGFRLLVDDNKNQTYHMYSAIQLQTNTQFKDLHTADKGYFEISNNTIEKLKLYKNNIQTYAIEFRNHESKMDYTLNITDNKISGESTKYLIAVINDTQNRLTQADGIGSGTINISKNDANIGSIAHGAVPIYVEEHNAKNSVLHGSVTVDSNRLTVREASDGYTEAVYMKGNAKVYNVINNIWNLHGKLNDGLVEVKGTSGHSDVHLNVANNTITTDIVGKLYPSWLRYSKADVYADANTHNGTALSKVNTTGKSVVLAELLSHVNETTSLAHGAAHAAAHDTFHTIADNAVTVGII